MKHLFLALTVFAAVSTSRVVDLWRFDGNASLASTLHHDASQSNLLAIRLTPSTAALGALVVRETIPHEGIPLPKEDWHGLRRPNYTDMYLNYTEPVYYIRTMKPIGFYDYIHWLASCTVLASTWVSTMEWKGLKFTKILGDLVGMLFFVISLLRGINAYRTCAQEVQIAGGAYSVDGDTVTYRYNSFARNFLAVPLIIDITSMAALALNLLFYMFSEHGWAVMMLYGVNLLAFLAALCVSFLFYQEYTLFLYADDAIGGQIACVVISLVLILLAMPIYLHLKFGTHPMWGSNALWIYGSAWTYFGLAIFVFHALCVGISYTLLGRTINDPWGATSCTGPLGVLQAAMDGIAPVFTIIMSIYRGQGDMSTSLIADTS